MAEPPLLLVDVDGFISLYGPRAGLTGAQVDEAERWALGLAAR